MAYVITDPCIGCKDTSCVDVCPVNCIHPAKSDPGFSDSSMLFINPLECIMCSACVPACPVNAIYEDADAVPAHQKDLAQANAVFRVNEPETAAKAEALIKAHIAANPALMALATDKRRAAHSSPKVTTPYQRLLLGWYHKNKRDLPWRRTKDPYRILVSEIMLQQTQVQTVIPYYNRWLKRFPTARALARAPMNDVLKAWEGLGYYSRARNLHALSKEVTKLHKGTIPSTYEALLALPGIGRYTAGAVLSIAFGKRMPVLDGNVMRVFTRHFSIQKNISEPATQKELWALAEKCPACCRIPTTGRGSKPVTSQSQTTCANAAMGGALGARIWN